MKEEKFFCFGKNGFCVLSGNERDCEGCPFFNGEGGEIK